MYSLLYGTIPLVRKVGGLADSVVDYTPQTLSNGTATGFHFEKYSSKALLKRMRDVLTLYRNKKVWSAVNSTCDATRLLVGTFCQEVHQ